MNFRFLYDPQRRILSIGYRLADAEGPGRLDLSYYDLLASEARLASFIAIAKGDLPETHWFHLGRLITSVRRAADAAVVERHALRVPDAAARHAQLPGHAARPDVPHGRAPPDGYGVERGVPWGISESAYNLVDLHDTYQYKAFGVPGLGLKRGLGDELVVAPYATALAACSSRRWPPRTSGDSARRGSPGACGFYEAIDYTHPRTDEPDGAERRRTARRAWSSGPSWRITRA